MAQNQLVREKSKVAKGGKKIHFTHRGTKLRMSTLTSIQHCAGGSRQCNQGIKGNTRHRDWKKEITAFICRISDGIYKKGIRINSFQDKR